MLTYNPNYFNKEYQKIVTQFNQEVELIIKNVTSLNDCIFTEKINQILIEQNSYEKIIPTISLSNKNLFCAKQKLLLEAFNLVNNFKIKCTNLQNDIQRVQKVNPHHDYSELLSSIYPTKKIDNAIKELIPTHFQQSWQEYALDYAYTLVQDVCCVMKEIIVGNNNPAIHIQAFIVHLAEDLWDLGGLNNPEGLDLHWDMVI